ncbi:hypothetical protein [Streptomyces californicus]|uniref:hypothetical protein n=1 Tax=Streptomyces californicus TaxID=67351 RepID=UPI00369E433A
MTDPDGVSHGRLPVEDRGAGNDPCVLDPVGVHPDRGPMRVHTCPTDPLRPHRPHRLSLQ